MANWKRFLGFVITALAALAIAIGIGLLVSQRFGFNQVLSVSGVLTAEIVIIGIANWFSSDDTTDELDEEFNEWERNVRHKANRIVQQWELNSVQDPEGRETIQNEITTACSDLEDLLSEPPTDLRGHTSQLMRRIIEAGEGFEGLQTRTKWGPVDMTASDPDIPTVGMSEKEIREQFVDQGSEIVDNARELVDHLESR